MNTSLKGDAAEVTGASSRVQLMVLVILKGDLFAYFVGIKQHAVDCFVILKGDLFDGLVSAVCGCWWFLISLSKLNSLVYLQW